MEKGIAASHAIAMFVKGFSHKYFLPCCTLHLKKKKNVIYAGFLCLSIIPTISILTRNVCLMGLVQQYLYVAH